MNSRNNVTEIHVKLWILWEMVKKRKIAIDIKLLFFSGVCSCFANFTGGDCGIKMNSPPILSGVSKESICDASKRACIQVSLYGTGYYPSEALKCRIRLGKVYKCKT